MLREGIERFPTAFLDRDAVEIRLLCDHRETLVNEREAKIPTRKLDYPGQINRLTRRLRTMPQTARVRVAREQVKRIASLTREAEALKRKLRDLIRAHRPELLAEVGCGPLCAAILIGQTAGAERFKSDAHFARVAGVAPIPVSSGRHDRHRLDRGGNRQLNRALHVIAITRGWRDPATRAYLARKQAEGKSRIEAIRCLKRHLARHYHQLLRTPPAVRVDQISAAASTRCYGSDDGRGARFQALPQGRFTEPPVAAGSALDVPPLEKAR